MGALIVNHELDSIEGDQSLVGTMKNLVLANVEDDPVMILQPKV